VIDVVLPALDEREALAWLLPRMPSGYRPIVVDNGSTDGSSEVASALGATVVREPRRGFGAACHAGLMAAEAELVCFMDADGSLDPQLLPAVADPVAHGTADLVLGARCAEPGAWPIHLRLANRLLARELRRRTGAQLSDLGPQRCGRRADLVTLGIADRRSGWPLEMVLRASRAGWRIAEVPVPYFSRRGGRSKVTGTAKGFARAMRDMAVALR
jgi:glycosyltransferase involved in cell wall biosynthesis